MRGYKRGDKYEFQVSRGNTRKGIVVRSDRKSITVRYMADKRSRTCTFTKEEVYACGQRKV